MADHYVDPYAEHISKITGLEIVAEKLGLVRREDGGDLETAAAAQNDHDGDGIPSTAPLHTKPAVLTGIDNGAAAEKVEPAAEVTASA